ncbi:hypothetical protein AC792_14705 [Arthrobacter sp. RIT-PI-e]|uniref:hypothetical protein n=1 Tax=Arthrobacter sp. RIT-PI-e TaxID=1681197 RepID=UPI0006769E33|nr:hypothetical protein [Arthrobacter sp. RIT-PI-e]KNC17320.1 hypothetical protein AC792_14705 [Arthrobacter sp. RIT-PI-e]
MSSVQYPGGVAHDDPAVDFLVEDFSRTGQTSLEDIGSSPENFDSFALSDLAPGTYVLGYRLEQFTATFALDCDGELVGSGELHSTAEENLRGSFIACGEPAADTPDEYERSLFSYCPA